MAVGAVLSSEVACHRYAGDDPDVIRRIGWELCDSPLRVVPTMLIDRGLPPPPAFAFVASVLSPLERLMNALIRVLRR